MISDLQTFGIELVRSLSDTMEDGQLHEPHTGEPVPLDQYAQTSFAVAAMRAGELSNEENLRMAGIKALKTYLQTQESNRGHREFNTFAVSEMLKDSQRGRYELPVSEETLVDTFGYESGITTQQGNNWLLLRAACELRLEDMGVQPSYFYPLRLAMARSWVQSDGIIADAPRVPIAPVETPLTYHAKMTYLSAIIARYRPRWLSIASKGIESLYAVSLPTGESLYFGRSENTIFGYASILGALSELFKLGYSEKIFAELSGRTSRYLRDRFDPKNPTAFPVQGSNPDSIDEYVFDTVYSAYAAMVLLDLSLPDTNYNPKYTPGNSNLKQSGIHTWYGSHSAVGFASHGQYKITQGRPDPRYAGMIPHAFTYKDSPVLSGIPHSAWDSITLPFLPTVRLNNDYYVPITWEVKQTAPNTIRGTANFFPLPDTKYSDTGSEKSEHLMDAKSYFSNTPAKFVHDRFRKRPSRITAHARRALHYIPPIDVFVIQTAVNAGKGSVFMSPYVVSEKFQRNVTLATDTLTETKTNGVTAHRGDGIWTSAVEPVSNSLRSSIILHPGETSPYHKTYFDNGIHTKITHQGETYCASCRSVASHDVSED